MISAYYPDAVSVFTLPRVRCAPVPLGLVGSAAFVSLVTWGVGGVEIQQIRRTSNFTPFCSKAVNHCFSLRSPFGDESPPSLGPKRFTPNRKTAEWGCVSRLWVHLKTMWRNCEVFVVVFLNNHTVGIVVKYSFCWDMAYIQVWLIFFSFSHTKYLFWRLK